MAVKLSFSAWLEALSEEQEAGNAIAQTTRDVLRRWFDSARLMVDSYAPAAPAAIADRACLMIGSYWASEPGYTGTQRVHHVGFSERWTDASRAGNALRYSGAMALLSPYKRRRALGGGPATPRRAEPTPTPDDGDNQMPKPAGIRFFVPEFGPALGGVQLPTMTAQDLLDVAEAEERAADVLRAVSVAAPVSCWQQSFAYDAPTSAQSRGFRWAVVAVRNGDPPPSHYRINPNTSPLDWAGRWRQSPGQAVDGNGQTLDVYWFTPVLTVMPAATAFEWPQ